MPWAAAAGAVAGALITSDSNRSASNNAKDAAAASDATQKAMYDQTRQDNMPALDARNASLSRMRELLGIGGNTGAQGYGSAGGPISVGDVTQDPGYQFGLKQGQDTLNAQLAARGMRNSGAALQAAARYGNDYATTKFDNAFNRQVANRSAQLNPLQSLAGASQTGASTVAGAGGSYANAVSANQSALGNALGASSIAGGAIGSNLANQLGGWYATNGSSGSTGNALRSWWGTGGAGSMNGSGGSVQGNSDYEYDL